MSVKRRVTVSMTVNVISDNGRPGVGTTKGNIVYEPLDNGLIRVISNFGKDTYDVEARDLIEMVIAVCSGTLVKMPDIKRALAEAIDGHGNGSSIESLT